MLERILPSRIDNNLRGGRAALWIAILIVLTKLAIAFNSTFLTRMVAQKADGIPIDTYTPAVAQVVVRIFALLGEAQFVLALICVLVLLRYRSLLSFLYLALVADYLLRKVVVFLHPMGDSAGSRPTADPVIFILNTLIVVGLILSFLPPKPSAQRASGHL